MVGFIFTFHIFLLPRIGRRLIACVLFAYCGIIEENTVKGGVSLGAVGKYHEWLEQDGLIKLQAWARDGLVDDEIAERMGISRKTLYEWKNKYPPIRDALKNGKEVVDIMVENALLKRALGYKYKETTKEPVKNPDTGEYELTVTKEVTKEVSPDVTAQIYWLKNRKPNEWRDRRIVENIQTTEKLDELLEEVKRSADHVIVETE